MKPSVRKAWIMLAMISQSLLVVAQNHDLNVIPYPLHETAVTGKVKLPKVLTYNTNMSAEDLKDLQAYLPSYVLQLKAIDAKKKAYLNITINGSEQQLATYKDAALVGTRLNNDEEAYTLDITKKGIKITANTPAGAFYALQTLGKMAEQGKNIIPATTIEDKPRFTYRGLHLDVSRHFFNIDFLKKQLDLLCTYKVNRLHWHLTDSQGWRLEIPAFPKLTTLAAWRTANSLEDWAKVGNTFYSKEDANAYGGYYTAADVKELIEYARLRHITIIPEIELPGHSAEVLAAYPELRCEGAEGGHEVCIGNEQSFKFFETVIDEVVKLFPSHYIHIGGDEASRKHWQACKLCQQRIKNESLKDENELQSYMIKRIEKYVNSKGHDIIGWDEILQGGLAPNATVMSWRGIEAGMTAAKAGHDVIMTPNLYCYLDYYQDDPRTQPLAFGGVLPIDKVYSYDPVPEGSIDATSAKHVLGVQGNLWTEQVPTIEHAEYMIYPRIIALAEVGWSTLENKDPKSFQRRVNNEVRAITAKGYHPFELSPTVKYSQTVNREAKQIEVKLYSERHPADIRYSTDGEAPTILSPKYEKPFIVTDSLKIWTQIFENNQPIGKATYIRADYHQAIGATVTYQPGCDYYKSRAAYTGGGDMALTDGVKGSMSYKDGCWQGFCPNDMDVIIDLGKITSVHYIMANFMQYKASSINLPTRVEVYGSLDGKKYILFGDYEPDSEDIDQKATFKQFGWQGDATKVRYIRYKAMHERKGFVFTDEIVVQ